jgi:hypothetical protein
MFTAFAVSAVVLIVLNLVYNAYILWYAKSGRYELDKRIDAATK